MVEPIFTIILIIFGPILAFYLAYRNYKRRAKKFADIESKCTQAISIADEIINNLKSSAPVAKKTNPVLLYEEMRIETSPFLHNGIFAGLSISYAELEIDNKNEVEPRNYIGFNENILAT